MGGGTPISSNTPKSWGDISWAWNSYIYVWVYSCTETAPFFWFALYVVELPLLFFQEIQSANLKWNNKCFHLLEIFRMHPPLISIYLLEESHWTSRSPSHIAADVPGHCLSFSLSVLIIFTRVGAFVSPLSEANVSQDVYNTWELFLQLEVTAHELCCEGSRGSLGKRLPFC